ncbi:hypothetical protein Tco_1172411 [Tanacetum coccineum]
MEKEIVQMETNGGVLQEREIQKTSLLETRNLKYDILDNTRRNGKEKKLSRKKRKDGLQNSPMESDTKSRRDNVTDWSY